MKLLSQFSLIFGLVHCFYYNVNAQNADTIWYDKKWKETSDAESRHFYRVIKPNTPSTAKYEVTDYYPKGNVQMRGYFSSLKPEVRDGEFKYYNDSGALTQKMIWVNNIVAETYNYDAITGKQLQHVIHREYLATLTKKEKFEKHGIKEIDKNPEFPGGDTEFTKFLTENINYPEQAKQNNIQGLVLVSATIDEKGNLKDVRLSKSAHPLLDEEAIRVAKLLPKKKWIPAMNDGKNISADFSFPFRFSLK